MAEFKKGDYVEIRDSSSNDKFGTVTDKKRNGLIGVKTESGKEIFVKSHEICRSRRW